MIHQERLVGQPLFSGQRWFHDAGSNQDQQIRLFLLYYMMLKYPSYEGNGAENREPLHGFVLDFLHPPA